MHVDPKLSFKSHVQYLESKVAKFVCILSKTRFLLSKLTRW